LDTEPVPVMTLVRTANVFWLKSSDPVTPMLPMRLLPCSRISVLAPPVKVMALAWPAPPLPPAIVP